MPSCSTDRNPRGVVINFTEHDHKYSSIVNGKEIVYVSGTTFVSNFFPKFDPTGEITKRCALREGITVESLKARWKKKGDDSCKYGTKIHETCEDIIQGHPLRNTPYNDKEKNAMDKAVKLATYLKQRAEILGVEKIIFDENLKIAGTMDLFVRAKKDGKLWICDYKTNEKIERENKYRNFGHSPISHLPDNNYTHYMCQLNLYEYLLKKAGYVKEDEQIEKVLFHITETGYTPYVLPSCQKEIGDMIDDYLKNGLVKNK